MRDINLFKANAEGEEESLFEQHHQHVVWVESATEIIWISTNLDYFIIVVTWSDDHQTDVEPERAQLFQAGPDCERFGQLASFLHLEKKIEEKNQNNN